MEYLPSDARQDHPVTPSVEESWPPAVRALAVTIGLGKTGYGSSVESLSSYHDERLQRIIDGLRTALTLAEAAQAERGSGDGREYFERASGA